MVRKLKYHEEKLLRKTSLLPPPSSSALHTAKIVRRFHLPSQTTYQTYNRLSGNLRKTANLLSLLPADDAIRLKLEKELLQKCYEVGLIREGKRLKEIEDVGVARFARRRLSERLVVLRMAESPKDATRFIEQGHVRVGPETVTDPAFLVSRNMEDFVTWVDGSKIKRNIEKYKGKVDDFDLL